MNIIKDIAAKTMTEEKRRTAKNDWFAFYIGRPLSYLLTVPFLKMGIKPNTVSFISIFPILIGFALVSFGTEMYIKVIGWGMFFLWNLLDGVDGNIARYKKQFSKTGSLWDATSGYFAMTFSFLAMGIGCYFGDECIINIDKIYFVIMGAISSILIIMPRLVMHKRISTIGNDEKVEEIKDKGKYSIIKIIGLNLVSIAGLIQVLMLLAIVFKFMDIFTIIYLAINGIICIISMYKLLR